MDLIKSAAYIDHHENSGGRRELVRRGDVWASERFLMKRWGWSVGKVRRALERWANAGRIVRDTKTERITICNYDTYSLKRSGDGAATERRRSGDGAATEQREVREVQEVREVPPSEASPPDARAALFGEGLRIAVGMTGRPEGSCRSLLGKWLKAAADDASRVLELLRQAERDRRADLTSWMEKCLTTPVRHRIYDPHTDPVYDGVLY